MKRNPLRTSAFVGMISLLVIAWPARSAPPTQMDKAQVRAGDLRLGSYATSRQTEQLATDEDFRARAAESMQRMGITKLYLEVYRSGHVVAPQHLIFARDWLRERNIDVGGGIATVPGGDFGVRQRGPLGWFNWQNAKTQRDLEEVIRMAAGIFDVFIVDDFLCTGDVSEESRIAKGTRSWGEYRRQLLTEVARSVFIEPAKQVNPNITMIVKYPQWYDRFHLFGYDTETLPKVFDQVWVGTETRGRNTQRFGFVQPYEGFVNYRWLAGIAGEKIGGAWFDHGDCAEHDVLDQAYTSVLAGAPELVFFNLGNVMQGHPDHEKIVTEFDRLADLAVFVREHPVVGVPAYKPPNSDPAGDMYIMDFLGMLGVPLVPVHEFPTGSPVIFLPAQAAADPNLFDHASKALADGAHLVVTTSLLIALPQGAELARLIGIDWPLQTRPTRAFLISSSNAETNVSIDLESPIEATGRAADVLCVADGKKLILLTTAKTPKGSISLLNTHTYSQTDFDAVGEVLLCPRPLGLLNLRGQALKALRWTFTEPLSLVGFEGAASVTYHPFDSHGSGDCVIQNFNDKAVDVTITLLLDKGRASRFVDRFTGKPIPMRVPESGGLITLDIHVPPRGRVWVQRLGRRAA